MIKTFKNTLKDDRITVWIEPHRNSSVKVTLEDKVHRYTYFHYDTAIETEAKVALAKRELESYLPRRGQRTSWTPW
jgi:hypothetical protein